MRAQVREVGCFVISWSQTEIDGLSGAPTSALRSGSSWCWRGDSVRLDSAAGLSGLLGHLASGVMREHVVSRTRSLVSRALSAEGIRQRRAEAVSASTQTVTFTDGPRRWIGSLIDVAELKRPLILFVGDLPPCDIQLRVAVGPENPDRLKRSSATREGVVCFAAGTRLETCNGAGLVEDIVAGDKVITKDGGAREVLWVGMRHISRARLMTSPGLRPVRISAGAIGLDRPSEDLLVSPDHCVVVSNAMTRDIWDEPEVLVAARDLVSWPGISRLRTSQSVTYYHLMLEEHGILIANGMEAESFHPGAAKLTAIAEDQRARLFDIMPELERRATNYGRPARRVLDKYEAQQLARAS